MEISKANGQMGKWIQLWQTLAKEQVRHRLV